MIDILIPYYGPPNLMLEALSSVLSQTDGNLRVIVVDDCHPDATVQRWIVERDDPRVDYFRNISNLGANANYRRALSLARADYVVFMGADDLMKPNYIARMREVITSRGMPDVAQPGVEVIDSSGRVVRSAGDRMKYLLRPRTDGELRGELAARSLLIGNWTYFPSLAWRRTTIEAIGFRQSYRVVQDLALLIDVLRDGGRIAIDSEVTFAYRRHHESDSAARSRTGARFREEREYLDVIAEELRLDGWNRAAAAARWRLTSRLNAAAHFPTAVGTRDLGAVRQLGRHVFGG